MSHGVVENWSDMETIWKNVFTRLKTTPKEVKANFFADKSNNNF